MRSYFIFLLFFPSAIFAQLKLQVFFDFNKDVPNGASTEVFRKWLSENRDAEILNLAGFADSIDENGYNKDLSLRRINSVVKTLKENNISISPSVVLNPLGEDFKQAANQSENRKVEIVYRKIPVEKITAAETEISREAIESNALAQSVKEQFETAKPGDLIRIDNINFYFNSEKIIPESEQVLLDLYQVMADHPKLIIEIHGHICCNPNPYDTKLSFRRAKFIFTFLLNHGIALNRLAYEGFGSSRPIYKIPEKNAVEEAANRRVEIMIVQN